jgi:hypothetical protein
MSAETHSADLSHNLAHQTPIRSISAGLTHPMRRILVRVSACRDSRKTCRVDPPITVLNPINCLLSLGENVGLEKPSS